MKHHVFLLHNPGNFFRQRNQECGARGVDEDIFMISSSTHDTYKRANMPTNTQRDMATVLKVAA